MDSTAIPRPAAGREPARPGKAGAGATTLTGTVFARLREDIVAGRLAPGSKLGFAGLRTTYGTSASPLREALMMLAAEGLVVQQAQRGFHVAPVTLDELRDVAELRAGLERDAVMRSIARGGDDWEAGIVASFHRLQKAGASLETKPGAGGPLEDEWEIRHRAFHNSLSAAAESPWLLRVCDRLHDQTERYRRTFWKYRERAEGAAAEHRMMMEAALARDAERIGTLVVAHVIAQAELTAAVMVRLGYDKREESK